MKASEYDANVVSEGLRSIASKEARAAAALLIDYGVKHDRLRCEGVIKGFLRDFRYYVDGVWAFAFIFNKASILFYIRRPILRRLPRMAAMDEFVRTTSICIERNSSGEYKVSVETRRDAVALIDELIEPLLVQMSAPTAPSYQESSMSKAITRPAAPVTQGQLMLYATSLRVKDLLQPGFYDIERLDPADTHDKGYQRVLNVARAKRLATYILAGRENQDAFLPTSIFLATDADLAFDAATNELRIDVAKSGPFSVVDGQHRLEGLRIAAEKSHEIGDFEVPVNIAVRLSKISQMCHFLIVNTTQKSVDKAVEQRLVARLTEMILSEDVPTLPAWIRRVVESGDDAHALSLIDYLNTHPESPWRGKIAIPNQEGEGTTISQKSFVVSIKRYVLAGSNPLSIHPIDVQQKIFLNYWKAISDLLGSEEETVLYKSVGVDLFCRFSGALFVKLQNMNDFKVSAMTRLLTDAFENLEGEFAGLGQPDWWLSGSGAAGRMNASALGKINAELSKALFRSSGDAGPVIL